MTKIQLCSTGSNDLFFCQNVRVKRLKHGSQKLTSVWRSKYPKIFTLHQNNIESLKLSSEIWNHCLRWKKTEKLDFLRITWPIWTNQSACKYGSLPPIISLDKYRIFWPIRFTDSSLFWPSSAQLSRFINRKALS